MNTDGTVTHDSRHPNGDRTAEKDKSANGAQRVDQIRDLIFGEQMTGYEERFSALEARVEAEISELRTQVETQLSELNRLMNTRVNEVEKNSVPRSQIATSLETLARTLRGQD